MPQPFDTPMTDADVKKFVRRCMNHLKLKKYELGITKADVDYAVSVTKTGNTNGARANASGIYIGLKPWEYFTTKNPVFNEYKAYASDPVIGSIEAGTLENMMRVIIAHEVAHHVQYKICPRVRRYDRRDKKPHGFIFRNIYRKLRGGLINSMVEEDLNSRGFTNEIATLTF